MNVEFLKIEIMSISEEYASKSNIDYVLDTENGSKAVIIGAGSSGYDAAKLQEAALLSKQEDVKFIVVDSLPSEINRPKLDIEDMIPNKIELFQKESGKEARRKRRMLERKENKKGKFKI